MERRRRSSAYITIDTEARDYLPHLYGALNWALVEDVKKLPLKVPDIYRG